MTNSGLPTAATNISASLQTSGSPIVFECAIVTVQFSLINNCAIGLPTIFDLPIITAVLPVKSPKKSLSKSKQPNGVQGIRPSPDVDKRPTLGMLKPSTSLDGEIVLIIEFSSM